MRKELEKKLVISALISHWRVLSAVLYAGLLSLLSLKSTAQSYTVTDLGSIGTTAYGINESGQVVGGDQATAFLWQNGTVTDLSTVGGNSLFSPRANAINDSGLIAGLSKQTSNGQFQATLWDGNSVVFLPNLPGFVSGLAFDVNNSGQVAGYSQSANSSILHAVLWNAGAASDLGVPAGYLVSGASAINDLGQVVGSASGSPGNLRAFLWAGGTTTELGTLAGAATEAWDINNLGQVVGWSGNNAFLWQNGTISPLPLLSGNVYSIAYAINDLSDAVGLAYSDLDSYHAVLWTGDAVHDLNDLIPTNSGWILREAFDINEQGQIAGWGTLVGVGDRAFLLTPVPEPSMASLLLLALAATFFAARKCRGDEFSS